MDIDVDTMLLNAIRDGLRDGIKSKLTSGYGNPLDKLIEAALAKHGAGLSELLSGAVAACIADPAFRLQIADQTRHLLAKTLVQRFGGELEKQVNQLKSDPATRARITLAIAEIVKERSAAGATT